MFSHVVLLFVLSAAGVLGAACFRKRFEETFPITCLGIVLILFLCGLCNQLLAGVYALLLISPLFYAISLGVLLHKRNFRSFCQHFFSPGFLLFLVLYAALTLLHYGRLASQWDEFSHWMDIVKEMFLHNDFGTHPASHSTFPSYPPGMALFQYFITKASAILDGNNAFSEWRVYFAYQLMASSLVFPFFRHIHWNRAVSAVVLAGAFFLSPMVFFRQYYPHTVYIDAFVGIAAGCAFAMVYCQQEKDIATYLYLLLSMMMLVLSKDVGLLCAILLAVALMIEKRRTPRQFLALGVGCGLAILLPKVLWNTHVAQRNIIKPFSAPLDAQVLLNVLRGTDTSYRSTVLQNYFNRLWHQSLPYGCFDLPLSWPLMLLLLGLCLFAIQLLYAKAEPDQRKPRARVIMILLVQTCVFMLGMCLMYMFKFPEWEAVALQSFDRYMGTVFVALLMAMLLMAFQLMQQKSTCWYPMGILLLAMIAILLPPQETKAFITRTSVNQSIEARYLVDQFSAEVMEACGYEDKRIYPIVQGSNGYHYYLFKFTAKPCSLSSGISLSANGPLYEGDIWTVQKTADQWKQELETYDYVMVYHPDDTFIETYGSLFEDPSTLGDRTLYQVDHASGSLVYCP